MKNGTPAQASGAAAPLATVSNRSGDEAGPDDWSLQIRPYVIVILCASHEKF